MTDHKRLKEQIFLIRGRMTPPAESWMSDSQTSDLFGLIRLIVEFNDYCARLSEADLEAIARGINESEALPGTTHFDASYQLGSTQGGIDSYVRLSSYYHFLSGALRPSPSLPINLSTLRSQHLLLFKQLLAEMDFTKGFGTLLDLFRIQLLWFALVA